MTDGDKNTTLSSTSDILVDLQVETSSRSQKIQKFVPFVVLAVITAHFAWATQYFIVETDDVLRHTCCDGYGFLMILYIFIAFGYSYAYLIKPYMLGPVSRCLWEPFVEKIAKIFGARYVYAVIHLIILGVILAFLIYDCWDEPERLIPLAGLAILLIVSFAFSVHRKQIKWHTIIWGMILQFVFGLFTLRWETGRRIFACVGDKVTTFLGYAKEGSAFVYGDKLVHEYHIFAFEAISTIYFLAFIINILYHVGIMQRVVANFGMFLRAIMGTSVCESVNSAANIFLGQTEAPLLLKPYLINLTGSEIHSVMTGGFASVSGTVLAAYISYGANAAHLITASVMAAPAGLVFSKLLFPEIEEPETFEDNVALVESEFSSVLDAASQGASQATQIVLGILANLIAFVATVYFINGVLGWFGGLVGFTAEDELWTIELIVGYIFTPVSFVLGVPWPECTKVGQLIGLKMMVNEFAAFSKFKEMDLTPKSQVIATFAICGFANPGSVGIMISTLSALIPQKSHLITRHVFRAYFAGTIVCFATACIAGMLSA
ncbi:PREDICTED: sodium/nucleoside cotransporter 2 [Nicrophorus vespilloides]|uniref:Sodium/nucleoside cotransporter 2 n=1 Tax=Nicrophorus vespilloides TaxID=110193 RepID=A0ABM1MVF4_NICVS|nr:PREDICTED: sodium/nucleoside cotransporter 2 [Nicrophorus vespilloides]